MRCKWVPSRGRPPQFCSKSCREKFGRDVERLGEEISLIAKALEAETMPQRDADFVQSQLARRQWLLARYVITART